MSTLLESIAKNKVFAFESKLFIHGYFGCCLRKLFHKSMERKGLILPPQVIFYGDTDGEDRSKSRHKMISDIIKVENHQFILKSPSWSKNC